MKLSQRGGKHHSINAGAKIGPNHSRNEPQVTDSSQQRAYELFPLLVAVFVHKFGTHFHIAPKSICLSIFYALAPPSYDYSCASGLLSKTWVYPRHYDAKVKWVAYASCI